MHRIAALASLLCLAAACAAEPDDQKEFDAWMREHPVGELEAYLHENHVSGILPTRSLLRTATDWKKCGAQQFEVPPKDRWPVMRQVLDLVAELKKRGILKDVEGASGYRNPELNKCANGAPRSAHTKSFAIDITADPGQVDVEKLCNFWRNEGKAWQMGMSRYPSGRIHLDVSGWRTWGADHTSKTSFCLKYF
ncbi:D-Ala-D-Ala carboxypeptidase family metallohydrolase [Ramlibacter albus]|uniref:Peptidase M15 n=1 Tax=Ramlibacter albus TaxID=2079448 RepID=A0A923M4C6_9BURK|nr:D-Ala-D-Ala carboxypeptidase family metallohydrolase [Ramlibacter albus]MBC5763962.1 peptidase M15 [Ramlibacter albus]